MSSTRICECEGRGYLSPYVEVFHYLSCGDPIFEALVPLGLRNFGFGRFPAKFPTEGHSCIELVAGIASRRVVDPTVFHLPTNALC